MAKKIEVSELIIKERVSSRGGGVEIDLSRKGFKGQKMSAYQNYLGGGMLGSIQNDCTVRDWKDNAKLVRIADELSRYFHDLTNHDEDEWESATYEENQNRPASAY